MDRTAARQTAMPVGMVTCAEETGLLARDVTNDGPHAVLTVDIAEFTRVLFSVAVLDDSVANCCSNRDEHFEHVGVDVGGSLSKVSTLPPARALTYATHGMPAGRDHRYRSSGREALTASR